MVPNVTKGGASFKGAAAYYLHDKEAETAERVAWTETVNLITSDPEKATGRKLEKPVYVYSLSWHPDEQPDKATMVEAAKESLKALGVEDRQALIVCHNDEPHPHVHVIINRVSMEDGRAANMRGDHLKLSRWAESWEERHGKIWCETRVQNNDRREQGEFVRGSNNVPRSVFEAIREGTKALNDN
ncbi:MAG: relaxase/mobilization nuclease domain-containing protein, partial [Alphaproteobacteria bacterium]|nr:relaxase/mobilization nuclease domain-containing protein [Alphaproteobacteria bacterium]